MLWPRLLFDPPMQVLDENDWPLGLISVRKAVVAETIPAYAVPEAGGGGTARAKIWFCVRPLYVSALQSFCEVPPLVPMAMPAPSKATKTLSPASTATNIGVLTT